MKKGLLLFMVIGICLFTACKPEDVQENNPVSEEYIVVGFSQLGAESDWRSSNTESMKTTFTSGNGYELIVEDGQQKQSNQITAIRTFIQQEVDYIVVAGGKRCRDTGYYC